MTYFEHLDESNAKVEICFVSEYQTQTEEKSDWEYGADVDFVVHLEGVSAV